MSTLAERILDALGHLIAAALEAGVPADELQRFLTAKAAANAELAADLAQAAKTRGR